MNAVLSRSVPVRQAAAGSRRPEEEDTPPSYAQSALDSKIRARSSGITTCAHVEGGHANPTCMVHFVHRAGRRPENLAHNGILG